MVPFHLSERVIILIGPFLKPFGGDSVIGVSMSFVFINLSVLLK